MRMESFKFLVRMLDTYWDKDEDGSNRVDLALVKDQINNFLDWVITTEWNSSENDDFRFELSSISPLHWYSLMEFLILPHAPERNASEDISS